MGDISIQATTSIKALLAIANSWTAAQRFNNNVNLTFGTVDGTDADLFHDGTDFSIDINTGDLLLTIAGGDLILQQATSIKTTGTTDLILAPDSNLQLTPVGGQIAANLSQLQFQERTAPGAGGANRFRLYAVVDGGSLTDAAIVFQDGTVDIFAQETTPVDSPIFRYPSNTEGMVRMRKPHPGHQIFEMIFPDGSSFVLKEIEHHDADKIAADQGSEGLLPDNWEVSTEAERAAASKLIFEKEERERKKK